MVDYKEGTVSVAGAELHYSTIGSGPTCLILNSMGAEPNQRMTPPELAERLQLVFVDLRGSGRSTGDPADLSFDVLASDLEAIRAELGVERVVVLGYSILGVLALEYARRCPESVSHLVMVGTPPSGDMASLAESGMAHFEQHASEERKQILQENMASLPEGASMGQAMHAQTPMRFYDPRFDATSLFEGADSKLDLLNHLLGTLTPGWTAQSVASSLEVPTFLAHGRHDYVVPHVLWDGVIEMFPNASLQIFEKSGHQPFFEEPRAFADAVSEWMADPGRRGSEF